MCSSYSEAAAIIEGEMAYLIIRSSICRPLLAQTFIIAWEVGTILVAARCCVVGAFCWKRAWLAVTQRMHGESRESDLSFILRTQVYHPWKLTYYKRYFVEVVQYSPGNF